MDLSAFSCLVTSDDSVEVRCALPQRASSPRNVCSDICVKCKCAHFSLLALRHICSIRRCRFSVRYLEGMTRPGGQLDEGHTYPVLRVLRHSAACPREDTSLPTELWVSSGHLHPGEPRLERWKSLSQKVCSGDYKTFSEDCGNNRRLRVSAANKDVYHRS